MFINHTKPRSAPSVVKQNAYFHPPLVAGHFGPLRKQSLAIPGFPIFLPSVITDDLTYESHENAEVFASLSPIPLYTISLYLVSPSLVAPYFLLSVGTCKARQALHPLNVSKSPVPDDILPVVLKVCPGIAPVFTSHLVSFPQSF